MRIEELKRINAILFFACKESNKSINRLKLMKLLWLSDRIHLNRFGRMVLNDKYCALEHGPVPSKAKAITNIGVDDAISIDGYQINAEDKFDARYFSKTDIEVMEEVWENFGGMNRFTLRNYSHLFPEWKRFEDKLNDASLPDSFPMQILDFFDAPSNDAAYDHDNESSLLSKEEYLTHKKIQEALS